MAAAQGAKPSATVLVPHASSSVRWARTRLAEDLANCGVPRAVVDDAVLVLSEVLSNALKHARGPTRPRPASPSLSALGGRGLSIVANLAADWGVREEPGESTVWVVLLTAGHGRR
ncbi:ATP-binding protein [Carbonactinospora thermoautotrophica]|uniref:ATP-binding protein n=1 Tax=Carbonactinospora thermoautotrophica TaxID=1469144 RepID=UPI003DA84075